MKSNRDWTCIWDKNQLVFKTNNGKKTISVNGKKQKVNEKDYCELICSKRTIAFRARLKHVEQNQPESKEWVEYIKWKLIRRTPVQVLNQMLIEYCTRKITVMQK